MTELNEKTAALVRMARANDRRLKSIKDRKIAMPKPLIKKSAEKRTKV